MLCRTKNGIEEIDISNYSQDYFFNSIDLGEMGEILLRRMKGFREHLGKNKKHSQNLTDADN